MQILFTPDWSPDEIFVVQPFLPKNKVQKKSQNQSLRLPFPETAE